MGDTGSLGCRPVAVEAALADPAGLLGYVTVMAATPAALTLGQHLPTEPLPDRVVVGADGGEVVESVGAALVARLDVMDVEQAVTVAAEEAGYGAATSVACERTLTLPRPQWCPKRVLHEASLP
jgi:hypothetical protein